MYIGFVVLVYFLKEKSLLNYKYKHIFFLPTDK